MDQSCLVSACGRREMAEHVRDLGLELPPVASLLMQSLRAVGYTVQAALADLIDNNIAAGARTIEIDFDGASGQYVATVDDGGGMDEDTLVASMRFGSRDPRDARTAGLGRFGSA